VNPTEVSDFDEEITNLATRNPIKPLKRVGCLEENW